MFRRQCYCFLILLCASYVTLSPNMTISLNKALTHYDKGLYEEIIYLEQMSQIQVNFTDVDENVAFIIYQVHSHLYNITMCKNKCEYKYMVNGTNIGHISSEMLTDTFIIINSNEQDLKLFVTVQGYGYNDPVPGGCNIEFPVEDSPYMKAVVTQKSYITVMAAPAEYKFNSDYYCYNTREVDIKFYIMYLPEHNFEPDIYFETIKMMSSLAGIERYGKEISMPNLSWTIRRQISAYPGTGAVYVAVATNKGNNYAVYVPTHSYACSPLVENDCELLKDSLSMLIGAILVFHGIFICYCGHRFFKTQMITIGFLSGLIVSYILLSLMFNLDHPAILVASALFGLCLGAMQAICWWIYGMPIFVIVLSYADIGFLVSCLIYYVLSEYLYYFQTYYFWVLFIMITLLITISLMSISYIASLACCAVLGAYSTIYPIDYYLGSNMKYILNNVVRRASVEHFENTVLIPPFQWKDLLLTFLWLGLATTGFLYQLYRNKGRPPFPPPPRSVRAAPEEPVATPSTSRYRHSNTSMYGYEHYDETTPLLR